MAKTAIEPKRKKLKLYRYEEVADEVPLSIRERADARVEEVIEANLMEFRQLVGETQAGLAKRVHATQSQISKTEKRSDPRLSVLRRNVEALGWQLRVEAIMGEKRVLLIV